MNEKQLRDILTDHANWLRGDDRGVFADLNGAYLTGADLSGADLNDAYLRGADLSGADLRGADLRGADLRGADLNGAYLTGADLSGADLTGAVLPHYQLSRGDLRVYKIADGKIVHLLIPNHIQRTASLVGRKCRAAAAYVLAIEGDNPVTTARWTTYAIGEWVYPDSYDPDPRIECTHGIHFFLTREEAAAARG